VRRRWLVASVVAAFLAAAGLVTALVLVLLPDPQTTADHSGPTPAASGQIAATTTTGTAATSATATTPTSTKPSITTTPTSTKPPATPTSTREPGPARLSGRIKPGVTYRGVATFYGADGGGNCMFDPAAISWSQR
jgi:cytoskeletal protein RodZ